MPPLIPPPTTDLSQFLLLFPEFSNTLSSGNIYIYPSLRNPPPSLTFRDQFAFQPTGSTTAAVVHLLHTITAVLENNSFAVVLALDFSKAFDSVRHSAVIGKFSLLHMPDDIYNWIGAAFFRNYSHCTRCGILVSQLRSISASIIQGSSIGPASYVVMASDLRPVSPYNYISKYADDTYLIIPADNIHSCSAEINNVDTWALNNNLKLKRSKSVEIVFVRCRGRHLTAGLRPTVSGFTRVDSIKILGVTFSRKFSVLQDVDQLLAACSQSLFTLRTLRQHGLPADALPTNCCMPRRLGGGSPLPTTVTAWRDFYGSQQSSATVPHRRPLPVCAPMLTTSTLPK